MIGWRLRTRLLLAYAGLIVLGFLGLGLLAGRQIQTGAQEDYARSLEAQAALVAHGLTEPLERFLTGELTRDDLENTLGAFAVQLDIKTVLVDTAGEAWLSAGGGLPLPSQSSAPEISAALGGLMAHAARTDEAGQEMLFAAAPVIEDGRVLGVVQLSVLQTAVNRSIVRRWLTLAAGALLLTILAIGAALWLAASFARPLDELGEAAVRVAGGDFTGRLSTARQDEFGDLARSFNEMSAQVEAMLVEQKAFAGNAAHELRAPLTAIRLRSEALRDGGLDEDTTQQYVVEIDEEIARLGRLITDLLLLSKLDAGRAEVSESWLDPGRLARSVCRDLQSLAAMRSITIDLEVAEGLPPIKVGQTHAQVLFTNILENSIKYGRSAGRISWSLAAVDGELLSIVSDDGQGLTADDCAHVFERFFRADKAHSRETSGAGLGLPLAQAICAFYGGRIDVTSPGLELGTTVTVHWPLHDML